MKKIIAFLLLAITWYFAGVNRQPALMTAFVCFAIALAAGFILPRVMKHFLHPELPVKMSVAFKETETEFSIISENRTVFPINRYKLTLGMKYRFQDKYTVRKLNGSVAGRSTGQEASAAFYFSAPYSGLMDISLRRLRVYDYLSVFSSSRKLSGKTGEIIVMPYPKEMKLIMPSFGAYSHLSYIDSSSDVKGEDLSEIRVIREYQHGDLTRHIHRNYSARTQKLWVKEYQKENDFIFDLLLDSSALPAPGTDDLDAFYELVMSVLWSIMGFSAVVNVKWFDKTRGGLTETLISSRTEVEPLMTQLLRTDIRCTPKDISGEEIREGMKKGMVVNTRLEWFFRDDRIYSFHKESIQAEIRDMSFDLTGGGV